MIAGNAWGAATLLGARRGIPLEPVGVMRDSVGTHRSHVAVASLPVRSGRRQPQHLPRDLSRTTRDWRLDVTRGLALFFLVVNHTGIDTPLTHLTNGRLGFVTGAEIFVTISGYLIGSVHHQRYLTSGWAGSARALLARARTLYLASVVAALLLLAALEVRWPGADVLSAERGMTPPLAPYEDADGVLDLSVGIATLQIGPWPINILALYVPLLLVAIPLVRLLAVPRYGTPAALAASVTAWAVMHLGFNLPIGLGTRVFDFWAWQILFVVGMAAGWHRDDVQRFTRTALGRVTLIGATLATAAFCIYRVMRTDSDVHLINDQLGSLSLFARDTMGIGRLVNVLVAVPVLVMLLGHLPAIVQRAVRFLLEGPGRASLYVFLMHLPVLLVVSDVARSTVEPSTLVNTAIVLGALTCLWLLVRHRVLFGVVPR